MQALKDNYDLWEADILSDRKKVEMAELKEQERIKQLQRDAYLKEHGLDPDGKADKELEFL